MFYVFCLIHVKTFCHQIAKFLAFKAYTRPHYLTLAFTEEERISDDHDIGDDDIKDLQLLDPLRRAFDLAEEAENFNSSFTGMSDFKKHYSNIQDDLEIFCHDLLTQCSDMNEVKMLLMHNPDNDDDDDDDPEEKNWEKALLEGRKDFVAHPFFQQYFLKMMAGFSPPSRMARFHWQWIYAPYVLAIYCVLPFVVFADFFRKADLLFVSPGTLSWRIHSLHHQMKRNRGRGDQDEDDVNENRVFHFFRQFVHTPVFRMIVHNVIELFYLIVLLVCLVDFTVTNKQEPTARINRTDTEHYLVILFSIFGLVFLLEDIKMMVLKRYLFFKTFWNPFSFVAHLIMVVGSAILKIYFSYCADETEHNLANLSGNHPINIGVTLISISVGMEIFKKLRHLMLFKFLGPIVLCITSVFKDIVRIASIYAIIYFAVSVTLWSLLKPFQERGDEPKGTFHNYSLAEESELKNSKNLWNEMVFMIFEPNSPADVQVVPTGEHKENWSTEFSHLVGIGVYALYHIIMIIMMLNVLISIMNTTYMHSCEMSRV